MAAETPILDSLKNVTPAAAGKGVLGLASRGLYYYFLYTVLRDLGVFDWAGEKIGGFQEKHPGVFGASEAERGALGQQIVGGEERWGAEEAGEMRKLLAEREISRIESQPMGEDLRQALSDLAGAGAVTESLRRGPENVGRGAGGLLTPEQREQVRVAVHANAPNLGMVGMA